MRQGPIVIAAAGLLACLCAGGAGARSAPTRAPGLWEITTRTGAGSTTGRECVDARTDRLQRQAVAAQSCTDADFKETPEGYVSAAGCKMEGISAQSRVVITGDFETWARAEVSTTLQGSENRSFRTTIETRRIGDCEPGQSPGDLILPNGKVIHVGGAK